VSLAPVKASSALSLDGLAEQVRRVWAETKAHQVAAWEGYLTTGHLLRTARERFPSDKEYGRWFAAQGFPFTTQWAGRLITLAEREPEVRALLETAVSSNPPGVNAVYGLLGNGLAPLMSSDSGEWQTPPEVVESVVAALGAIDLDPCSNSGTPNVPAARHFTIADNGLDQGWRGRVYMNPPYGREIGPWIDKLARVLRQLPQAADVSEASRRVITTNGSRGRAATITMRRSTAIAPLLEGIALAEDVIAGTERIQIAAAAGACALVVNEAGRLGYRATTARAELRRIAGDWDK
jgi:hypothetical protein